MAEKYAEPRGPFRAHQLHSGDRYELRDGHAIYCAPTGGDGARAAVAGAQVLETDPAVDSAGFDAGYSSEPDQLRAPDIAVGNVPDAPGWIRGVPPLAVEYASRGQDEGELQAKIAELLDRGTRYVWVVRLMGPRRVEVYEPKTPPRTVAGGEILSAPGILKNDVPVEALYDRDVAHRLTLRNLLQREGYEDLAAVRAEGRDEGRETGRDEARRETLLLLLRQRFGDVSEPVQRAVGGASGAELESALARVLSIANPEDVLP